MGPSRPHMWTSLEAKKNTTVLARRHINLEVENTVEFVAVVVIGRRGPSHGHHHLARPVCERPPPVEDERACC